MKKLKAIWELMRLEHGVMIAVAIVIGAYIAQQQLPEWHIFAFTFCTALFLEASTFALNDYLDVDIDKKNKRIDRPLVRGDISPKTALVLFAILFPLGLLASYFVNLTCFLIALITALFAVLYDTQLKKIKLLGNFFIAYTMAIPFVFGGAAVLQSNALSLNLSPSIFILACIAFSAGSGREIMKDIQDYEGDKSKGVKSFPRYLGIRPSQILAATFYLVAIALSLLPYALPVFDVYYQNFTYLLLVFIADTMFLMTALQLIMMKHPQLKLHRKFTLAALCMGLIAFLGGALAL